MRKGLISFIIIQCMLIPFTVGCQSNSADTASPTQMQNQTTPPELSAQETEGNDATTAPDATVADNTPETNPLPTDPAETEPSTQGTESEATDAPTEPPRETTPPVTEEPEQTEPKPTQPKPTEPVPTTPVPTEPKPTDPPVTEPSATEPPATEPAELIDLDALVQYGLNYAANTYGYRIYPGTRAGYYPAYTCVFSTMEEGKADIRGCVDDTTRALLAVPGTQIAVEINGVMCRTRIDIVIMKQGDNNYLVNVFYG